MATFIYEAQTAAGQTLTGTMTAADQPAAQQALQGSGLRVLALSAGENAARIRAVSEADFQAFNTQLAHLTEAGLPVERGLDLIAHDLRSGPLAGAVSAVALDLQAGVPLAEAFARRANAFPPLYSKLVDAGVKSHNLPGMLLGLGKHLEMVSALREALWRALAYPLILLVAFAGVMTYISLRVLPQFRELFSDFKANLPGLTKFIIDVGPAVPWVLGGTVLLTLLTPVAWHLLVLAGTVQRGTRPLTSVPILGSVVKKNMLARWCDVLKLAVTAGVPLPQALDLAGDSAGHPGVREDSQALAEACRGGRGLETVAHLRIVPPAAAAAIQFGAEQSDLPRTLAGLVEMYRQQARQKTAMIPAVVTPIVTIIAAALIGLIVIAMFLPLIHLIQSVTGGE